MRFYLLLALVCFLGALTQTPGPDLVLDAQSLVALAAATFMTPLVFIVPVLVVRYVWRLGRFSYEVERYKRRGY
jgi:hypothetical protein